MNKNITYFFYIQGSDGGKDSVDCANIILNMYEAYFKKNNFIFSLDKDLMTFKFRDEKLHDILKREIGTHRIIRISPFDRQKRRHTSFVQVSMCDENEDKFILNEKDIRIDRFRAQGKGGQHVNKTESAVRITHIPTGIQAVCQDGRSQLDNKAKALENLKRKLEEMHKKKSKKFSSTENIIRSYFFFPTFRIIDHISEKKSIKTDILEGYLDLLF